MDASSAGPALPAAARWMVALLAIAVFVWLDTFHLDLFRQLAGAWRGWPRLGALAVLGYGPQLLVPLGLAALLAGPGRALAALGLHRSPLRALALALACTLVLPLGYAAIAGFAPPERPVLEAMRVALVPGIGEEVLYRAFLFGFLFRFAGWGFLPAALVGALFFGAAHLSQGHGWSEAAAIAALTGFGALWFAWLYVEWDYDLWVPVVFHVLMNLYWALFGVADDALGPLAATLLRLTVVALSVAVTLATARRRGGRAVRGRDWLWRAAEPRPRRRPSPGSEPASVGAARSREERRRARPSGR
ncbi:CPBP family intramembrane metalloprotease [Luteimonas sp. RD2P54]|uniref:CPBP family intramembrane metalloprotease n=1 Tax=Luteimonas endophytica TaxID=3042023 RepID=A0ABT6JCX3_9GAMM|nr:CPBP family intramembrane metalloprotease [Luteimonas endophytica]MDH5824682.1 CPBP family intramembrane metalloprotease [Luteimonas endophytica]